MAYSQNPDDYIKDELRKIAERHYIGRKTFETIGIELDMPRAKVAAACEAARRAGIVHIVIDPPAQLPSNRLREIAVQLREKFGLLDCTIVNGRPFDQFLVTTEESNTAAIRAVIVDDMAGRTAEQLASCFRASVRPYIAVTFGIVVRKIVNVVSNIRPPHNTQGFILAAQGIRQLEEDRFDTPDITRDLARAFGCKYAVMPIPMLVEHEYKQYFEDTFYVKSIMHELQHNTNIVFSTLGPLPNDNTKYQYLSHSSLEISAFPKGGIEWVKEKGAIGNLGGWWFDPNGNLVDYKAHTVPGLGLKRIQQLVKERKPVILAVAADPYRIPVLAAALTCNQPLGNILITDDATARILLDEWEIPEAIMSQFSPIEKQAVRQAQKFRSRW